MKVQMKVVGELERAYCINTLNYQGKEHVIVASEKRNECRFYDLEGNQEEVIWKEPGGTMTICQLPDETGAFLATHRFYAPYDSDEASIVMARPGVTGWKVQTIVDIPHVHRFDILKRNGTNYLIVCTINSGCEYKGDWRFPGKIYTAQLPDDLNKLDQEHPIQLEVLTENCVKNHGYYRIEEDGQETAVISTEEGVFLYVPPKKAGDDWEIEKLLNQPVSDAIYMDFDGDGKKELLTLAPFHGENLRIYKDKGQGMEVVYDYPEPMEFLHAMWAGVICGKVSIVVGGRKGTRNLLRITYDEIKGDYSWEYIDKDCGSANVCHFVNAKGQDVIASANREINEVTFYTLTEE